MTGESPLALAGTRVPDFHHAVFTAGDEAQVVGGQGPNAFDMAEEGTNAACSTGLVRVGERVRGKYNESIGGVVVGVLLLLLVWLLVTVRLSLVNVPEPDR